MSVSSDKDFFFYFINDMLFYKYIPYLYHIKKNMVGIILLENLLFKLSNRRCLNFKIYIDIIILSTWRNTILLYYSLNKYMDFGFKP